MKIVKTRDLQALLQVRKLFQLHKIFEVLQNRVLRLFLAYFMFEKKHKEAFRFDLRFRNSDYDSDVKIPVQSNGEKNTSEFKLHNWPVFFISSLGSRKS